MKATVKLMALATAMVALASCSSDSAYNPNNTIERKQAQYEKAFVQQFGEIAPNQDWGFGTARTKAETRGWANANANEWGRYVEVPSPLTDAQIQVVTAWFETHKNPEGIAVNWSDFFVQQVSSTEYGGNMDLLTCGDTPDHINNFNNGDGSLNENVCGYLATPSDQNSGVMHSDKIQFMVSSSTTCFGYKESAGTVPHYNDKYVIIPGDWIDSSVAGMFFVGLDYQKEKDEDGGGVLISADGYYNDWIVKITPGLYTDCRRIMAEDLGSIGDFDFNDVVFDVRFDGSQAVVILRAAGGTLPLYVAGKEVHELLGVSTSTMINTYTGKHKEKPVAIFRVETGYDSTYNDIAITVDQEDGSELVTLTAEEGKAPRKICINASPDWSDETTKITDTYPDFEQYVSNPALCWWNRW